MFLAPISTTTPFNDTMHMFILGKILYSLVINYVIWVHKCILWIVMGMLHHMKINSIMKWWHFITNCFSSFLWVCYIWLNESLQTFKVVPICIVATYLDPCKICLFDNPFMDCLLCNHPSSINKYTHWPCRHICIWHVIKVMSLIQPWSHDSCVSHMITNAIVDVIIDSCFWCNVSFISYWNLGLLQKMLKYFGYFGV